MAWKDQSLMEVRAAFARDHAKGLLSMTELCHAYGVSRKTGYKWLGRAQAGESLANRSRRPQSSPNRTPQALEQAIVAERVKHPTWGPDKIRVVLTERNPSERWPSATTMGSILSRHGLVQKRRRRRDLPSADHRGTQVHANEPNDVWSSDFKGEFKTGDGRYCHPLTVADVCSRFVLNCHGLLSITTVCVMPAFEWAFREYGLPRAILTDNGSPFASSQGLCGLTQLSVWWMRLGILPITIEPGKPQQNGRHERMHRTLKAETTRPPGVDLADQQKRFDAFVSEYNHERPHQALGQIPPGRLYEPSSRRMPSKLGVSEYPGHFEVRSVRSSGCIKWGGEERYLSMALVGQRVGLVEIDEDIWSLYLDGFELARMRGSTGQLIGLGSLSSRFAPVALRAPCAKRLDNDTCYLCPW